MVLVHSGLHAALLGVVDGLGLHILAFGTHAPGGIHTLLESITLPAENVVGMLAVSGVIAIAEVEWLGSV